MPVFTYNHSPYDLLGKAPDCDSMGYFIAKQVNDIYECLNAEVDFDSDEGKQIIENFPQTNEEIANEIQYKYYSTMKEAAIKGCSVAVLFP